MQQKSKYIILMILVCFVFGFFMTENALAQLYESQSYTPVVVPAPPGTTGLGTYKTVAGPAGMTYLVEDYEETTGTRPGDRERKDYGYNCNWYTGECSDRVEDGHYRALSTCEAKCYLKYYRCKVCGTSGCKEGDCYWKTQQQMLIALMEGLLLHLQLLTIGKNVLEVNVSLNLHRMNLLE